MKRLVSITLVAAVVALLAGAAVAQMGPGGYGPMGMRGGMMGPGGWAGPGAFGPGGCPGFAGPATATITEEKAKEVAQQYADKYLQGFTVERVLPFTGMHHTMYVVELKGPKGESRTLHVNPWGGVRPFGGPVTVQ